MPRFWTLLGVRGVTHFVGFDNVGRYLSNARLIRLRSLGRMRKYVLKKIMVFRKQYNRPPHDITIEEEIAKQL